MLGPPSLAPKMPDANADGGRATPQRLRAVRIDLRPPEPASIGTRLDPQTATRARFRVSNDATEQNGATTTSDRGVGGRGRVPDAAIAELWDIMGKIGLQWVIDRQFAFQGNSQSQLVSISERLSGHQKPVSEGGICARD